MDTTEQPESPGSIDIFDLGKQTSHYHAVPIIHELCLISNCNRAHGPKSDFCKQHKEEMVGR